MHKPTCTLLAMALTMGLLPCVVEAKKSVRKSASESAAFKYCPDLDSMATEVLESHARGMNYPWGLESCRDRSVFKSFNPGEDDGSDGGGRPQQVITAQPKKPFEIARIIKISDEEYEVEFDVLVSGSTKRIRQSLVFAVADGPQAKDPDVGCVVYIRPPKRDFIRQDCLNSKAMPKTVKGK